jgi:hypothetical protein
MVRSRSSQIAFRAVLAFISLSFYYACALLSSVNPESNTASWRALSNIFTLAVIQQLTHYLLPDDRQPKHRWIARLIPVLGIASVMLILGNPIPVDCDIRYICAAEIKSSSIYSNVFLFMIFLAISYNLYWIFRSELRLNNRTFYFAVLIGSSSIGYAFLGTVLNQSLPRFIATFLVLVALSFIGYSVARHQALVERRTTIRDYPVSVLTISGILGIYLWVSFQLGLSMFNILMLSVLVIITHAAADYVRDHLDREQKKQDRAIRFQLRNLGRDIPTSSSIQRPLRKVLSIMLHNLEAKSGFIAVREDDIYVVNASLNSLPENSTLHPEVVNAEDITQPGSSLSGHVQWLVPAYGGGEQVASIGVGSRSGMKEYTESDLFWIEDVAEQLGALVFSYIQGPTSRIGRTDENLDENDYAAVQVVETEELLSTLATRSDPKIETIVEEGFRNLHDYSELGRSPLVQLFGIHGKSHIDSGKQVQQQLIEILEKLRPLGNKPPRPITREWYCYTILHDAYLEDTPTRDIMSKLYISEGTYYRTRRKALRMISRELMEKGVIA